MDMGILETGKHETAAGIDDSGAGAGERPHVGIGTCGKDAAAAGCKGGHPWL